MSSIWRHCDALDNDNNIGAASGAHIFSSPCLLPPSSASSHHVSRYSVSLHKFRACVYPCTSDFVLYLHLQSGQHRGGGSNSSKCNRLKCRRNHCCEACPSVPNVEMKVQWSFSFSQLSSHILFHSTDQLDKTDTPPIPKVYKYIPSVQCFILPCNPLPGHTIVLYITLTIQKMPA